MSNSKQQSLVSVGSEDLKEFPKILRKVEETNIFPFLLKEDNYTKVSENLYKKGDNDLIKLFYENDKWQYTNLKNSHDRGSFVQFIANRWESEHACMAKSPAIIFQAAKVANEFYEAYIKSLKHEHKEKPILLGSTSPPARRR